jgi:hypothetical protein
MLRTRRLQLKLETDIKTLAWQRGNEDSTISSGTCLQGPKSLEATTIPSWWDGRSDGQQDQAARINELERELRELQQTMHHHADLSSALAFEEEKERAREARARANATVVSVASKFVAVCEWRASSNVSNDRNQTLNHQWRREYGEKVRKKTIRDSAREHQDAIMECVAQQVRISVEECEHVLAGRLHPLGLQLSRIQCLVQNAKDHHLQVGFRRCRRRRCRRRNYLIFHFSIFFVLTSFLLCQSVESMVSAALLSRNDINISQLTTTLSPAVTARFSTRAGREASSGMTGMDGMDGMSGVDGKGYGKVGIDETMFGGTSSGKCKAGGEQDGIDKKNVEIGANDREEGRDRQEEEEDEASKKKRQIQEETSDFEVGIRHVGKVVWVESVHCWGTIRFFGHVANATSASARKEMWVGVSLSLPKGRNDGMIGTKRYFPCKKRHGIFVKPNNVREHPIHGNPRKRRSRAVNSLETATALKKTLARMVAKHK